MPQKRSEYGTGTVRRKGQSWQGRFYHEGERVEVNVGKVKDYPTEAKARKELRRIMAVYQPPTKGDEISMGVLCDKFIVYRESDPDLAPNSLAAIKSYIRTHIRPEFGSRIAAKLTADDLERFK